MKLRPSGDVSGQGALRPVRIGNGSLWRLMIVSRQNQFRRRNLELVRQACFGVRGGASMGPVRCRRWCTQVRSERNVSLRIRPGNQQHSDWEKSIGEGAVPGRWSKSGSRRPAISCARASNRPQNWRITGSLPALATVGSGGRCLFFCPCNTHLW